MDTSRLGDALDNLVRKYRTVPFSTWEHAHVQGESFHDYASDDPLDANWWQAHTDVLEIVVQPNGRRFAQVAVVLYPSGVHSLPPAPGAGMLVHDDGKVEGTWANGEEFEYVQPGSTAV